MRTMVSLVFLLFRRIVITFMIRYVYDVCSYRSHSIVASTLWPCGLCRVVACLFVVVSNRAVSSYGVSSCGRVELCRVEFRV